MEEAREARMLASREGVICYWDAACQELLGYSAGEAVGQSLDDLLVPADACEEAQRQRSQAWSLGNSTYESLRRRKDGGLIYVNVSVSVVRHGTESFILESKRDITRLKAQRDARMLEARFRDLLESLPDAIVIINSTGRIVLVNRETERLFGYSRPELLAEPIEMLLPERFRGGHLRHRSLYFAQPRTRAMGAGLDLFGLRRGGLEFPVEISLSPLQTDEGMLAVSAIRDLTDRRRAEEKFRALLEAAPDAMVIVDGDGHIVLVNHQTELLFGHRREDLLDRPVELLVPERFRHQHLRHRELYSAHPRPRGMGEGLELYGLRSDGSEVPIEVSLSPLQTEEGILFLSAIRDVTERRQAELRLQHASRMKSEFLAHMSHELRTPLNAIIGFDQVLLDDIAGPLNPTQREYLGDILNAARHLLGLINDVLDLSRVESGKLALSPTRFPLRELVLEVSTELSSIAFGKAVRVIHSVAEDEVFLDRGRLRQIVSNLLSNALKFTEPDGQVEVKARLTPGGLELAVCDTGIGIRPSDMHRLFREFEQLDSGSSRSVQGTGLGLALTRKLVEVQGGQIEVQSEPGVGSAFTVRLPQPP